MSFAVVVLDFDSGSHHDLTVCRGDVILPIYAEERSGEWWLYACAAERPADIGWVPAHCVNELAAASAPRLSAARQHTGSWPALCHSGELKERAHLVLAGWVVG